MFSYPASHVLIYTFVHFLEKELVLFSAVFLMLCCYEIELIDAEQLAINRSLTKSNQKY